MPQANRPPLATLCLQFSTSAPSRPPPCRSRPAAMPNADPALSVTHRGYSSSGKDHAIAFSSSSGSRPRSGSSGVSSTTSSSAAHTTLSSALTEERLRESNSRSRYDGSSPYYRGLTDSGLALRGTGSPGRESHATASTGAPSFSSSVLLRFQEWVTSCTSRPGRGRDVDRGSSAGGAKAPAGGGGGGGSFPGPTETGATTRIGSANEQEMRPTKERVPAPAVAIRLQAKPVTERVPAEAAVGPPVVHRGGNPLRESNPTPPMRIAEPLRDEKPSTISKSGKPLNPLPASASVPAPLPVTEAHGTGASSGVASTSVSGSVKVRMEDAGKERVFVWADRYRPRALDDFICNRAVATELREMVHQGEYNHFIFEGSPGVGKKTMISALLREVFGPENLETIAEVRTFELKGEAVPNIEANVKTSSRHIEINLSELHGYARHVVVALIKGSPHSPSKNTIQCDHTNCRAIILYEADKLSTDSQHYIRWLMEKYKACFKIIFCCSDASKLHPVKHLCKVVTLQPPSHSEIVEVLEYIATKEGIDLLYNLAKKIADNAKQNLRQAIRSFEASWQSSYPFKENQEILTGWEEDIANVAKKIVEEQSPRQLFSIREKLKNLIEHNVSPRFIFDTLQVELKKHLDDHYHAKLDNLCEEYKNDMEHILDSENSLVLSQDIPENMGERNHEMSSFMTIEEFAARFMSFYKSSMAKNRRG